MLDIIISYSILAGIMGILLILFTIFFEKNKKRGRTLLIWAVLFIAISFATSEYAFWLKGYNLFELVFSFNFPLLVYFITWFLFIIWLFESRGERKIWMILLVLLIIIVLIATSCMNCVSF